jgi:hypothetical protein
MLPLSKALLTACFILVSCLAYSSTLRMEAKCSSKPSFDSQYTTQLCIPEDRTLENYKLMTNWLGWSEEMRLNNADNKIFFISNFSDFMSQKGDLFITATVRTANPTHYNVIISGIASFFLSHKLRLLFLLDLFH